MARKKLIAMESNLFRKAPQDEVTIELHGGYYAGVTRDDVHLDDDLATVRWTVIDVEPHSANKKLTITASHDQVRSKRKDEDTTEVDGSLTITIDNTSSTSPSRVTNPVVYE